MFFIGCILQCKSRKYSVLLKRDLSVRVADPQGAVGSFEQGGNGIISQAVFLLKVFVCNAVVAYQAAFCSYPNSPAVILRNDLNFNFFFPGNKLMVSYVLLRERNTSRQ